MYQNSLRLVETKWPNLAVQTVVVDPARVVVATAAAVVEVVY
jgi:hypothetical protein